MEFTYIYTNICSLQSKHKELLTYTDNKNPTIILLTETLLKPHFPDVLISIPGYTLYRNDRLVDNGGGVAIYVKDVINHEPSNVTILNTYATDPVESIWIEIKIGAVRFTIACIYRPPRFKQDDDIKLRAAITEASSNIHNLLIFGDLNYPGIDWTTLHTATGSSAANEFLDCFINTNLSQLVNFPTRYRNTQSANTLDLVLASNPNIITNLWSDPPIGTSDHVIILAKSQINTTLRKNEVPMLKRNFKAANYTLINEFLTNNFNSLLEIQYSISFADFYSKFVDIINQATNRYVPFFKKRNRIKSKPWINNEILSKISEKRNLWNIYKSNKTTESYNKYRLCNNALLSMIRTAHNTYVESILSGGDKKFFSFIKKNLCTNITTFSVNDETTNSVTSNPHKVANIFAKSFKENFCNQNGNTFFLADNTRISQALTDISVTEPEVANYLNQLKDDGAIGPDGFSPYFIKKSVNSLTPIVTNILKRSLQEGSIPEPWKLAHIIPIYKSGDRKMPENYRPVSITCTFSKCLEKIITQHITNFCISNSIIPNNQHGFMPGRSVTTNHLHNLNSWTKLLDNNIPIDVIYLDFSKAFDRVPLDGLVYKLEHFGIRGALLKWIKLFLSNRSYCVQISSKLSKPESIPSGVIQGSVIGPLLFNIYISDFNKHFSSTVSFFADDTKFYNNPVNNVNDLHSDLRSIENWCSMWKLSLNSDKCNVLHLGSNNPNNSYVLNNILIKSVNQQKDLGIIITKDLKWESHIANVVKKTNSLIFLVKKSFPRLSLHHFLKIYKAYIRPRLEFCSSVWQPYYQKDIDMIEKVQRRATKIVPSIRNFEYNKRLDLLNLPLLEQRRKRGDLIDTFKIINGYYKCELISLYVFNKNRNLRGHSKKLSNTKWNKLNRKNFLSERVVSSWNALPEETITATSVNNFKNLIDATHFSFKN